MSASDVRYPLNGTEPDGPPPGPMRSGTRALEKPGFGPWERHHYTFATALKEP